MLCELLVVGWLSLAVPIGYVAAPVTFEDIAPVAGPPGTPPVRVWNTTLSAEAGPAINVTVFGGLPPYPGGPMVVAERATVDTPTGAVDAVRTKMFMGIEQDVVVAYPTNPAGVGSAMVVVHDLPLAEALPLLAGALRPC
ncbi:MAG: hypothetical protein AB7O56_01010 [Bauldia sp.]